MPVGERFPGKQWILNGNHPVIFDAGAWNQPKKMPAAATAAGIFSDIYRLLTQFSLDRVNHGIRGCRLNR